MLLFILHLLLKVINRFRYFSIYSHILPQLLYLKLNSFSSLQSAQVQDDLNEIISVRDILCILIGQGILGCSCELVSIVTHKCCNKQAGKFMLRVNCINKYPNLKKTHAVRMLACCLLSVCCQRELSGDSG